MAMYELYHHGIKGQKWGVRRYQNKDGSLTPAGVKRYATAGYARDSKNANSTVVGKAYDTLTGAHKINAKEKYERSSTKKNEARAEKYLAERDKEKAATRQKVAKTTAKTVAKGAEAASKLMLASAVDDVFYGGVGKKIAKETVIQTGRAAVTAYTMARGGYDIHWYDN